MSRALSLYRAWTKGEDRRSAIAVLHEIGSVLAKLDLSSDTTPLLARLEAAEEVVETARGDGANGLMALRRALDAYDKLRDGIQKEKQDGS